MKSSRPWLWLLVLVPIGLGLVRLRFDVEVLNLLPGDVPAVQGLAIYQQHFANARELIVTVRAGDAEQAEATAALLADALRWRPDLVSEVHWQPPWLDDPGQLGELVAYLWFNQPPETFGALTNAFAPTNLAARLDSARDQLATSLSPNEIARLAFDPVGLTRLPSMAGAGVSGPGADRENFSSPDGTFRLLFVQSRADLASYRDCVRWLKSVRSEVDLALQATGRDEQGNVLGYTGRPAFVAEIAGGMERDITGSVGSTVLVIIVLFGWAHRRARPLLWILALLALILGGTLALGGLLFGTLNVVSVGFAAILLGLAVDYGLVLYQESLCAPHLSARELSRTLTPGILWSAITTAGAFFLLNFGGLPGLAQLGSLVAIGVSLAAIVMLCFFLPPLLGRATPARPAAAPPAAVPAFTARWRRAAGSDRVVWTATALLGAIMAIVLSRGLPVVERNADSLRPRHSLAYATLEEIKQRMGRTREPHWLIVAGRDEQEVARRLDAVQPVVQGAVASGEIESVTLPNELWPRPVYQLANRAIAGRLADARDRIRKAAAERGFTDSALAVTERVLDEWQRAGAAAGPLWPTNDMSRWILEKLTARTATNLYALGLVYPAAAPRPAPAGAGPGAGPTTGPSKLADRLSGGQVWLASWEGLGAALLQVVERDLRRLMLPLAALLAVSLWLAFRRPAEVLLSLACLGFSILALLTLMKLAGWSWNLLNLMALPLLLGAGVDYSIHMQLALRRHGGDIDETRRSVGRALFLCAATTVAGFGSNVASSNGGLVSLGQVCAAGIACAYLTSTWLLPVWWHALAGPLPTAKRADLPDEGTGAGAPGTVEGRAPAGPSLLYRVGAWRLGIAIARRLPPEASARIGRGLAACYWHLARARREAVIGNLLPPLDGDRAGAEQAARSLFGNFAQKLVDLWRYEGGAAVDSLFDRLTGWEHFTAARETGRGILLLTPHLGNWEFGAPLLAARGVNLLVITMAEPQARLTELRRASRSRWGIETLVIGTDPFAFVEIIRRLEAGAVVALLVDRPPAASAVPVELFGRKFLGSIAPAELARAAGCVLLPVCLPRTARGYAAHILPPIPYDRAALRSREARGKLTQEILRAFEPAIRQHPDQWYHFISIWRDG